jgi:hypothetical protein
LLRSRTPAPIFLLYTAISYLPIRSTQESVNNHLADQDRGERHRRHVDKRLVVSLVFISRP